MFLILSYPFMCMEYIEKEWTQFLSVLFSIGGIVLLWFLWLFFSSLKASPLEKVVSAVVCRHCGIVFGFLTLFGALSIPIMKMRENYWFSRDEFNSTNKYELGGNRLGDEVARKLGQRMRDFHLSIEELER